MQLQCGGGDAEGEEGGGDDNCKGDEEFYKFNGKREHSPFFYAHTFSIVIFEIVHRLLC
jgi:hypothetical protein